MERQECNMQEKSLVKNSFYFIVYRTINVIYPLITATYVSRVMEPSGIGEVSLAQTVVIFLVACALLGIPNYGVREVSRTSNKEELSKLFSEIVIINIISTIVVSALYFGVVRFADLNINKTLYYIEGIILLLNVVNVDWFYQGIENFKYIVVRSCIVKVISVFAIFIFVRTKDDICIYALIFAMAYAGNYLLNIINLRKYVNFMLKGIVPSIHLKKVAILAITYISNEIYVTVDSVMLGILSVNSEVGYYSNSMKVIKILINIVTATGVALLPRLSVLKNQGDTKRLNSITNQAIKLLLLITLPAMLGMFLVSDEIVVVLFGIKFGPAAPILAVLSVLIVLRAFSNLFLQILISSNKDGNTSVIYLSAMIGNVVMNYFLIRSNGAVGAAVASVISELYIMCVLYNIARKYGSFKIGIKYFGSILISCLLMVVTVRIIYYFFDSIYIRLFLAVLGGTVIYFLAGFITKNESILWIVKLIKRRSKCL